MRTARFFSVTVMILMLALSAGATPPPQLVILGAGANTQTGLLTIVGVNLGGSTAVVKISNQTLAVQTASDTEIVATMPSLAAGTYLLSVSRGPASVDQDTFSLSIGSGGAGGDIESVTAGSGLVGGGTSGDVTLAVDASSLDASYLRRDGSNNGPFARLDIDNQFQGNQDIAGQVEIRGGFRSDLPSYVQFDQQDAFAFGVANWATTGTNRAITAETFSESSIAIVASAHAPTGGTGGAFTSDGDNGNGLYASNNHSTGGGSAVFAEVFSASAIPGRFRNNGGGTILEGIGNTWPPVFSVAGDGTVTAFDFVSSSSKRYKTNVAVLGGALEAIERLQPVTFDWKATGKHDIGLIAEDVAAVIPDAVAFDKEGPQGIDYQNLTALLIAAMKEQQAQIRALQRELANRN